MGQKKHREKRDAYRDNKQADIGAERNALLEFPFELSDFRHLAPPYKI